MIYIVFLLTAMLHFSLAAPTIYGVYTPSYANPYNYNYNPSSSKTHATMLHLDVSVRLKTTSVETSRTNLEMSLSCILEKDLDRPKVKISNNGNQNRFLIRTEKPHVINMAKRSEAKMERKEEESSFVDDDDVINREVESCDEVASRFIFTLIRKPSVYMVSSAKSGNCLSMKRSWVGGETDDVVAVPKRDCNPQRNPNLLWSIRPLNATTLLSLQSQFPQTTLFLSVADIAGSAYWIQPAKRKPPPSALAGIPIANSYDAGQVIMEARHSSSGQVPIKQHAHEEHEKGLYVGISKEANGAKTLKLVKRPEVWVIKTSDVVPQM
ncbi:hypothetical protein HK098_007516 [Nowakowskiella sp. JEL0407]|nr:hypothetical protein HK098_007516 [Nowakowskiella sp. JEL0407]